MQRLGFSWVVWVTTFPIAKAVPMTCLSFSLSSPLCAQHIANTLAHSAIRIIKEAIIIFRVGNSVTC